MGQKVNPIGLRVGINRDWDSIWFAKKREYGKLLMEDYKIRDYIKKNVVNSGVSQVIIERTSKNNNIPTGLDSIASGLGDDSSMLEFIVEPYLIQLGFLMRTPRGRLLTALGKKYIDSKNDNF